MKMKEAFKPSVLLSESHYHFHDSKGIIAEAVDRIASEGLFESVEVPLVTYSQDRARMRSVISRSGLHMTTWMSYVLAQEGLNLSSLDESIRRRSVRTVLDRCELALDAGSSRIGVLSGPDCGPKLRHRAMENLYASLCELCASLARYGHCSLTLEALDRGVHKNGLIGPTQEAAKLVRKVRERHPNMFVNWDSAHAALNGEVLADSFSLVADMADGIHLANAVLDPSSDLFGDHHIPIKGVGFLDVAGIAHLFQKAWETGCFDGEKKRIAVEVRAGTHEDPWKTIYQCWDILEEAWGLFCEAVQQ